MSKTGTKHDVEPLAGNRHGNKVLLFIIRTMISMEIGMYMHLLYVHVHVHTFNYEYHNSVDSIYKQYNQWCGNSQSCRTLSNKSSECPVNGN